MGGMYIINGVHGPEPRSSGGNTSVIHSSTGTSTNCSVKATFMKQHITQMHRKNVKV